MTQEQGPANPTFRGMPPFVDGSYEELVERFYEEAWSDGLPVVIPTERLVDSMLEGQGDPDEVLGMIPPIGAALTRRLLAVNAVMAGCRPEYLSLVEAMLRAALAPEHNFYGVTCTTHMCVSLSIISGPQVIKLGFNATDGAFGNGSRANGAVGRCLRLVSWNLGGARPGAADKSNLSHPGEWGFCIAEDEEGSPWEPFHVERGCPAGSDAVTVFACDAPRSVGVTGSAGTVLDRLAGSLNERSNNSSSDRFGLRNEMLIVMPSAVAKKLADAGMSKADVKRTLWEQTKCRVRDRLHEAYSEEAGVQSGFIERGEVWADWSNPDAELPIARDPDQIHVVVAGGGSYFAAVCPGWGPFGGFAVTERVGRLGAAR
jgi:hypothetical protein